VRRPLPNGRGFRFRPRLEAKLRAAAFESSARPCRLAGMDSDHLRVAAPNEFSRNWLAQNHLGALQAAARDVLGGNPRVTIEVDPNPGAAALRPATAPGPPPPEPSAGPIASRQSSDTVPLRTSDQ